MTEPKTASGVSKEQALQALSLIEDIWEMAPDLPYTKTLRRFIEQSAAPEAVARTVDIPCVVNGKQIDVTMSGDSSVRCLAITALQRARVIDYDTDRWIVTSEVGEVLNQNYAVDSLAPGEVIYISRQAGIVAASHATPSRIDADKLHQDSLYELVPESAAEWFAECPAIANADWRGGWDACRNRIRTLVDARHAAAELVSAAAAVGEIDPQEPLNRIRNCPLGCAKVGQCKWNAHGQPNLCPQTVVVGVGAPAAEAQQGGNSDGR